MEKRATSWKCRAAKTANATCLAGIAMGSRAAAVAAKRMPFSCTFAQSHLVKRCSENSESQAWKAKRKKDREEVNKAAAKDPVTTGGVSLTELGNYHADTEGSNRLQERRNILL